MYYTLAKSQKKLNNYIYRKQKIQPEKVVLEQKIALLVELGELANELKFFKYWKDEIKPNYSVPCTSCSGRGTTFFMNESTEECVFCDGTGEDTSVNPVLEEFVDVLHFILTATLNKYPDEIELGSFLSKIEPLAYPDLAQQFDALYYEIANGLWSRLDLIWRYFLGLAELLEFTDEMIEKAYYSKNQENFARQDRGY